MITTLSTFHPNKSWKCVLFFPSLWGGRRRRTDACKYSDVSVFGLCVHGLNEEIDKEASMEGVVSIPCKVHCFKRKEKRYGVHISGRFHLHANI